MTVSQNGWLVDATGGRQDRAPLLRDITVPNGVLAGDVATVFRWLASEYDFKVERLIKGTCWGWYVKTIEGGTSISNHASGTAVDFNAEEHPLGAAPLSSFSPKQITACRQIVSNSGGVLRWGGDYTGRKDSMHWEINASAARVKVLAALIRADAQEAEDDMDQATFTALLKGALKDTVVRQELAKAIVEFPYTDARNPAGPTRALGSTLVYGPGEAGKVVIAALTPDGA